MTTPRKRLALASCVLGSTVVGIDGSVVGVALPAIRHELGGGLVGQQWVSNAYLLTLGALLLLGGTLGDAFGPRRTFTVGLAGFGISSLLCAVAPTVAVLVAGRALQGVSGALLVPAALAVIVSVFDADERSRAIGSWAAWSGIGAALGPLVGGQLVDAASWRWVFLLNIPILALTIGLLHLAVRPTPTAQRVRLDVVGALLGAVGLACVSLGLIQQPLHGWDAPSVVTPLLGGLAVLVGFVAYERRAAAPMLPVRLFTRRNFVLGNLQTFVLYASLVQLFFYLVIYLQEVAGWPAVKTGLTLLPVTVVMLTAAGRFGRLADRHGPRAFTVGGPLAVGVGLLLLLRVDRHVTFLGDVLPAVTVIAFGLAVVVAPQTAVVLADADEHNAGTASGVNNALGRVAALVGVATVGIVIAAGYQSSLDEPHRRVQTAAARAALHDAESEPMSRPDLSGLNDGDRRTVAEQVQVASTRGFRAGVIVTAGAAMVAGLIGCGIRNPRRARPGGDGTGEVLVDASGRLLPSAAACAGSPPPQSGTLPAPTRRSPPSPWPAVGRTRWHVRDR